MKKNVIIIVALLTALILAVGIWAAVSYHRIVENPASVFEPSVVTTTPTPVVTAEPTTKPTLSPEELQAQAEQELKDTADPGFMKNRVNILLLGWDQSPEREDEDSSLYRDEDNNFRSDVMMILSVDFENKDVRLISIPRDTMADVYNTTGHWKINAAFAKGGSIEGEGFDYAIKTVENLMGITIPYYAGVDMTGVKAVVDAMGGVDYNVDLRIVLNGRVLETGYQHMDGQQVLDYCRARKGYGTDINRADRQQRMLFSIFEQLQSRKQLVNVPKIFLSVKDYVHTNLTVEQIAALAVFGMDINIETQMFRHTLEGKYMSNTPYSGAAFYVLDTEALKELVKEVFGVTITPDYRYDYRYVEADIAAADALEYVAGAEYLCGLFGVDITDPEYLQAQAYTPEPYGIIGQVAVCAQTARDVATRQMPKSLTDKEKYEFLQQPLDEDAIATAKEALMQNMYALCASYGLNKTNVEKKLLPEEFYDILSNGSTYNYGG